MTGFLAQFELDEPMFPLPVGAVAAGIPHATFRMYANPTRAPLVGKVHVTCGETIQELSYNLGSTGTRGRATLLTFRGILTYAVATALIQMRFPSSVARDLALNWTLIESGDSIIDGSLSTRRACQLFEDDILTLLVVHNARSTVVPARFVQGELRIPWPFIGKFGHIEASLPLDPIYRHATLVCFDFLTDPARWRQINGWRDGSAL